MYKLFKSETIDRDVFMCILFAYATMAVTIFHQKMALKSTLNFWGCLSISLTIMSILGFLTLSWFTDFILQMSNVFFCLLLQFNCFIYRNNIFCVLCKNTSDS